MFLLVYENKESYTCLKIIWKFFLGLLSFTSLFILSEGAKAGLATFPALPFLALPARLSANGYASDYAGGQADLMLPIRGDIGHNLYIDPSVAYATDKQGYVDVGLGYRWVRKSVAILGVYLFGGYTRIDNNARLWVANPGIEAFGSRWDMRLNGYIPMGDRNDKLYTLSHTGPTIIVPGSDVVTGHSEFAATLVPGQIIFQHAGNGVDLKLAYQLFPRMPLKGYLGSYFFAPAQVNNIWGVASGLEYWIDSNVKVLVSYSYDTRRRSTAALGMGVEFGGTHVYRSDPSITERITDPVERYLAELGRGSGIPSRQGVQNILVSGAHELLFDNIAFFSQRGSPNNGGLGLTLANCTFENPCGPNDLTNISTSTLETLLPNTRMYFNGGSYVALDVPFGANGVTLRPGQSVSSRTPDYSQPATGAGRSTFSGAFVLTNNNTLNNVIALPSPYLGNSSPGTYGVKTDNATNFLITGSQLGVVGNAYGVGVGHTGIPGIDASSGVISNSQIFAQNFGVAYGGPSLTIQGSTVNVTGNSGSPGVFIDTPNSFASIIDSQINVAAAPFPLGGNVNGGIVILTTGSTVVASNTTVNASVTDSLATAIALSADGSGSTIQFNQGALALTGPAGATLITKSQIAGGTVTISPSTICTKNGTPVVC